MRGSGHQHEGDTSSPVGRPSLGVSARHASLASLASPCPGPANGPLAARCPPPSQPRPPPPCPMLLWRGHSHRAADRPTLSFSARCPCRGLFPLLRGPSSRSRHLPIPTCHLKCPFLTAVKHASLSLPFRQSSLTTRFVGASPHRGVSPHPASGFSEGRDDVFSASVRSVANLAIAWHKVGTPE